MNNPPTDIFTRIKNGELSAYEKVFKLLYAELCGYAYKIVHDKAITEEIVQEVFFVLWKDRTKINITTSLKSYLYKSVYNRCIRHLQHKKVEQKYVDFTKPLQNKTQTPQEIMENNELYAIITDTLNNLPERCQKIFKMNRYEGLKYKEIADKLSISIKTVEANMGKALKAFRHSLKQYHITE